MEGIHSISKEPTGITRQLAAIMFADMVEMRSDPRFGLLLKKIGLE